MRLIIRADASTSVGTGHVMRTSAIAEEFLRLGHEVFYVGYIDSITLIHERFKEIGLVNPVMSPEVFVPIPSSDILLIDSYTLSPLDPFISREKWLKLCAVCDSVTPNCDVDLVIRPSLSRPTDFGSQINELSGPDYVLLRKAIFKNAPRKQDDSSPLRILLVGGGSDPSGFCNAVAAVLVGFPYNFSVDIFSDNFEAVEEIDSRLRIHKVGIKMDEFASKCDIALTLASSLSLELIAREIPVGVASAFQNQKEGFLEMVSSGFAVSIGERNCDGNWMIDTHSLGTLLSSVECRSQLRAKISDLIDLKGAQRVALEIINL